MSLIFQETNTIKKAVQLINELDSGKFPRLLSRILQKLHVKDERTFSEEEEEKLQGVFQLSARDLQLVIESCEFFFQQAAYHTAKPALLAQQLSRLQLQEDKVNAIVESWTSSAKEVMTHLRHRTFAPKQLQDVKWRLNLEMASSNAAKLKQPNAMFELGIRSEGAQEKERIQIEFSHEELYEFYSKLEVIQGEIDKLS